MFVVIDHRKSPKGFQGSWKFGLLPGLYVLHRIFEEAGQFKPTEQSSGHSSG